jgi:hypothetical protein
VAEGNYESKAIISSIQATSRASVKVQDSYYTVEYQEERVIPDVEGVEIEEERRTLWDTVNAEVDSQIADILKTFKKK